MTTSIVLATYNGERYLAAQLESFTTQTLLPDQLVVCDDASDDATWSVLKTFAGSAPFPVRLRRNKHNLGFGANFASAIAQASGEFIFMSDQDDVWFPTKLERMVAAFDRASIMVVTCDQEITDRELNPTGQTGQRVLRTMRVQDRLFATGCCSAVRSEFRVLLLPLPPQLDSHDIWLQVLAENLQVQRIVPEVFQYHRRHGDNITAAHVHPLRPVRRSTMVWRLFAISQDQRAFLIPYFEALIDRLEHASVDDFPRALDRDAGLERAQRRVSTMRERYAIALGPRRSRIPAVFRLLRAGDYAQFSGLKSASKDLLAKRISPNPPSDFA